MTFDDVFTSAAIGAVLAVSNGTPQPAGGLRAAIWRSHNFQGPLLAKIAATESAPRALEIEAANGGGVAVSYRVTEGGGHSFTLVA